MSRLNHYMLISLPAGISSINDKEEAFQALQAGSSAENSTTVPFAIPEFKIGTLDALVQQAEELAKLQHTCEAVTNKIGDALKNILDGDEDKIAQQKTINDKPATHYLSSFSWNKIKYRADRPIGDLIERLSKDITGIDNEVKSKYSQYNQAKSSLSALQKKQTGNLSNKSLSSIVPPSVLVQGSEYLETHLIAVPNQMVRDFPKTYETVAPWVVPRSAVQVDADSEFTLFAVTVFRKYGAEFVHKCREQKWIPRDYKYKEGGREEEQREIEKVGREERKLWNEALRLGRTNWGEAAMAWIHVMALRVFVETVLRYGLPLNFVCGLVKTNQKSAKKIRQNMDDTYSYLAGNALGRDKKGRVLKDDAEVQAHQGGEEFSAYVCYEFEII